jgi:hypothetical protein
MRLALRALVLAMFAVPCAAAAGEVNFTPYIWIPGVTATVGEGGGGSPGLGDRITLDFSQNLRLGGAMVNASWTEGPFVVFGDWTYANVRGISASPFGALYGDVNVQIVGNVLQLFSGYAVLDKEGFRLEPFLGARGYILTGRLKLEPGAFPAVDLDDTSAWLDAVAGLRAQYHFAKKWTVSVRGDVGAGGSNLTWQLYGVGGYEFSWGALIAGWRYLYVDQGEKSLRLRLTLSGPIIGVNFVF